MVRVGHVTHDSHSRYSDVSRDVVSRPLGQAHPLEAQASASGAFDNCAGSLSFGCRCGLIFCFINSIFMACFLNSFF